MKNNYLALLVGSALLLMNSCNRDDDNSSNSLIGTWYPVKEEVISGKDMKTIIETYNSDNCEQKSTIVFTESTVKSTSYYNDGTGKCVLDGTDTLPYTFDANKMKVTVDGSTADVKLLNNSEMRILFSYGEDINDDGVEDYSLSYYKK